MNTVSTKNMILSVIIPAQNVYTYCNPNLCISIIHLRDNVSRLVMGQCSFLKSTVSFQHTNPRTLQASEKSSKNIALGEIWFLNIVSKQLNTSKFFHQHCSTRGF